MAGSVRIVEWNDMYCWDAGEQKWKHWATKLVDDYYSRKEKLNAAS